MTWQPIETSPMEDDVRVDLWCVARDPAFEFRVPDAYRFNGEWYVNGRSIADIYCWTPLYWMPPPPPPEGR
jgi:hypothetical protein